MQLKDDKRSPGEYLRAELERLGFEQGEAAKILGVSRQSINNVINGRQFISRKMAKRLGAITGHADDYWLSNSFGLPSAQIVEPSKAAAAEPAKAASMKPVEAAVVSPARDSIVKPSKAVILKPTKRRKLWQKERRKAEPFRSFVLRLSAADTPKGDLVDAIKEDRSFPAVDTWAELRFHLLRLGTNDERLVTARALWKRYAKSLE